MITRTILALVSLAAIAFGVLYALGEVPPNFATSISKKAFAMFEENEPAPANTKTKPKTVDATRAPAITIAHVTKSEFVERILVTGTLVAKDKVLVAPEVEGLRVIGYQAEEGDNVTKEQILATLEDTTLVSSLDQNSAAIARAQAAIAQAESQITEAQAILKEASASLQRARPLRESRHLAQSTLDQRESAANTAKARLTSARSGLTLAKADKTSLDAQRRELQWRLSRSQIKSPVNGLISKRNVQIGEMASATRAPMFEIIRDGAIELDAEIDAENLSKIKKGQTAVVDAAGVAPVTGTVRLVSPQVDQATRLGHVRIFLGPRAELKVGAYARGRIETARTTGLSVPLAAVLYGPEGASVLRVENNVVRTTSVKTGLQTNGNIEIRDGLNPEDIVVAKAGTFLRDGDEIRAIEPDQKISESHR